MDPTALTSLDEYLQHNSYIQGYCPSQADVAVFHAIEPTSLLKFTHLTRWHKHIASFSQEFSSLPGKAGDPMSYVPKQALKEEEDTEDIDLFGSDEEEDLAAEKLKQERLAAYAARKASKPKITAKSVVTLDVKPWDDETDIEKMAEFVKSVQMDGLVWGASKFVPVGFGIKKLQITLVVEDEKVSLEELQEILAERGEEYIQSTDIAAMQKL